MGFHTYPVERAAELEDASRYRFCSREELLGLLALDGTETVVDLGSGTGFYTDDVAPFAERVHAVDLQEEMHDLYREKGLPGNVTPVTADVADLPLGDGECDAAVTTMTYHEFYGEAALSELRRVLRSGGRLVVVDWSRAGTGDEGPPREERYDLESATAQLEEAGFSIEYSTERPETFALRASTD
ncbi:class I SAM-dependent methyltransferase [Halalkalicoccus jeotgali]|uniref:Methyltransferase type 11 n=1 Tax=Halalkalicoccus jeotgali (strain DSM 18796 / CECT 7217 / JCM 14584 / KCTC 4019 / B3) TaxID=795797 RepID=D8J4R4_HALJB|nr:class I SAM-dependent methyltransferase [Halalkalicoccus jeotgali]ADJ15531.1 Methyltransferase type 11 [Halalkalicoccus jeotgali B3]ELY36060.1 type 11 methyltransferase [Halalkalicoccus jeotgali B3]